MPILNISAGNAFVSIIGTPEIAKSKTTAKGAYMHAAASCGNDHDNFCIFLVETSLNASSNVADLRQSDRDDTSG